MGRFAHLPVVDGRDLAGVMNRLDAVFNAATPSEVLAGMRWYADAHDEVKFYASLTGHSEEVVAAAYSALSPQTNWPANVRAMRALVSYWLTTGLWGMEDYPRTDTLYATNDRKAWQILLTSDTLRIGKGPKTNAFALNLREIAEYDNGLPAVTVDTRYYQAGTGTILGRGIKDKRYNTFVQATVKLAKKYGIEAYQFQAIVWVVWGNG